jgi:tetratricopeptide (TPR) repeat protein
LAEPVLVGRERELAELEQSLNSTIDGKGATVFVSGEAGCGKTRLTSEFLNLAKKRSVTVLTGWCLSNAAVPFFPFVEAFDSILAESENDTSNVSQQLGLKTWLASPAQQEGRQSQESISPQIWRDQKFAAVTKELLFLSTDKPLILFIDDLHWADSASLALLHYISRVVNSERILVLATFRTEELGVTVEGLAHPLLDTLRLMGREDLFKEVKLLNLSQADVGRITENMLNGKVDPALVEKLGQESRGNALFVIESLRMMFESGSLVQKDDAWQLAADKLGIPTKVKDIILRRLDALKPNQRRTLDVASVVGDKFDPQLLGAVLNQDSLDVLETLNSVALSKSLVVVEGDYYRFDHAKSREVLYDEILLPLKKGYHERVAERIESLNKDTKHMPLSDLAYHYIQAGNKPKSIQFSLAAGKDAYARFSNAEAIRDFTYVINAAGEVEGLFEQKTDAMEGLGDALFAKMMFKEAAKTFERLAQLGGDKKVRALRKAMEASFFQNDIPNLNRLIEEADKCNITDRLEKARILMNKGRVFVMQGKPAVGAKYHEEALRVFEEEYSLWDTAWNLVGFGSTAPYLGKLEEALAASLRSISLFRELGDSRWLIEAYNMAGLTFIVYFGFWQEGLLMLEKAAQVNEEAKIGDFLRLAQINAESAMAYSGMGDLKTALTKSQLALKYAEKTDSDWGKGMAYAGLTMYCAIQGDVSKAEENYEKLVKLPHEVLSNPSVNADLANGMLLAAKKQWGESMRVFDTVFVRLKANPNPAVEAVIKSCYAWTLVKRRRLLKALSTLREARKFYKDTATKFAHANLQAAFMAPARVAEDEKCEARLDVVNISRAEGALIKIENLSHPDLIVESVLPEFAIQNGIIEIEKGRLEPLSVTTVKLCLRAKKAGTFCLSPRIIYLDERKTVKAAQAKSITITAVPSIHEKNQLTQITNAEPSVLTFGSVASQKAFDFLIKAFREDYLGLRMPPERSGWRTLMDIVREGKVSKYSVYGAAGSRGRAIAELEHAGVAETRIFAGERGRGGEILKVRVSYEKEVVRQRISRGSNKLQQDS